MFSMLHMFISLSLLAHICSAAIRRDAANGAAVADSKYGGGGSSGGGGGYGGGGSSGGGYGGGSTGGSSYGGGGGGSSDGSYGGGGGGGGGGDSYGGMSDGGGGDSYGDSGGGGGGNYDTGNLYYYYYPSQPEQQQMQPYYPPSYEDEGGKDKDKGMLEKLKKGFLGLGALSIPVGIAVAVAIPLLILGAIFVIGALAPAILGILVTIFPGLAFLLGRSMQRGDPEQNLFGLELLQTVHSAFGEYKTLATDANCRRRVICEVGYVLKMTDDKNLRRSVISFLDNMVPRFLRNHYTPLVESLLSTESGKCQKYVCNVARFMENPASAKGHDTGGGGSQTQTPDPATQTTTPTTPSAS